ncbi:MAG TPA: divergent polysaccharide deacetylase family protein [Elusimicrobiota bacterium]|nr:divergent polysaccharide deacetylase family protein [Elusimicrobiota bacterium]
MKTTIVSVVLCLACSWASAVAPKAPNLKPEIAVVIDDFGLTYKKNPPDNEWMKIKWPITFSDMPESPRTAQAARETIEYGHQLLIHFPFDPFLRLELPADRVDPNDLRQVKALLAKARKEIPGAVGLNNHRSTRATMNRPLMAAFMRLLKPTGLFFLDSHVSSKTVAYAEAKKAGLRAADNFVFLEEPGHYNDEAFAESMIRFAARHARKTGRVVLIGHHYFRGTYEALMKEEPLLKAQGFDFVFASQIAR